MKLDLEKINQLAEEDPEAAADMVRKFRKAMIVLARNDPAWFCQYVLKTRDGGMIRQKPHHHAMHNMVRENQRSVIWTFPECGKDVWVGTKIPTPGGWKIMGDLQKGDKVFDRHGKATNVTFASEVFTDHKCYELSFDDGSTIIAGEDHLWLAHHTLDRHKDPQPLRTVDTKTIAGSIMHGDRRTWALPLAGPAEYPEVELPVHPYVLGAWLGDGDSRRQFITCHEDDRAIFDRCASLIEEPSTEKRMKKAPHLLHSKLGGKQFAKTMRALGVMGDHKDPKRKHIPELYLTASVEQRRELLAGLVDTDGTANKRAIGKVELCFCNKRLAEGTLQLIRSLGFKARMSASDAKIYGVVKGTRYRITFTAHTPVFWLKRKLDLQMSEKSTIGSKCQARYIVSAKEVPTVHTKCISVDSADHSYIASDDYTVTHNTLNIAVGHVLWRLGKDHNRSFGILSNAAQTAANTVAAMKCEIRGTKVLKSDGSWAEVQDLTDWTRVKTLDTNTWQVIDVTARSAFNGHVSCYKIELDNGHIMYVTPNHPLFVDCGEHFSWRQAQDLSVGRKVMCIRDFDIENYTTDEEVPPEAAEMVGYILAGRTLPRTDSLIVRINNRNKHWGDRRETFCNKLGWSINPYDKWTVRVDPYSLSLIHISEPTRPCH
jgi:hypothetical protein